MPENEKHFIGKVALVTGADRALGRELCLTLARQGASLVLAGRDPDALAALAKQALRHEENEILVQPLEAWEENQAQALVEAVQRDFGGLDLLLNAEGAAWPCGILDSRPGEVWEMLCLGLWQPYLVTRLCLPLMLARGSGEVVLIAGPKEPTPGWVMAQAAGAAVGTMAEALRAEGRGRGVRVLTVRLANPWPVLFQSCALEHAPLPNQRREILEVREAARRIVLTLFHPPEVEVRELVIGPNHTQGE